MEQGRRHLIVAKLIDITRKYTYKYVSKSKKERITIPLSLYIYIYVITERQTDQTNYIMDAY